MEFVTRAQARQDTTLAKAARAAAPFLACAMAYGSGQEEEAFQDLEIAVGQFRSSRGSSSQTANDAAVGLILAMRAYLTAAIPVEAIGNVATAIFTYKLIEEEWR